MSRATHLVMTGEALTAEKAFDYGLAYRVCESERLDKTVEQLLKKLRRGIFKFLCCHERNGLGSLLERMGPICGS